jgi:hypothetical protein
MPHSVVGCVVELLQERPCFGWRPGALGELPRSVSWLDEGLAKRLIPRR